MISLFEKATNTKLPEAVEAKITVDTWKQGCIVTGRVPMCTEHKQ